MTGASKGIGAAIAKQLAADSVSVVVDYASSREAAEKVLQKITAAGGRAIAVPGSVANESDVAQLFAQAHDAFGRVDILVNNAGVCAFAPLEQVTAAEYRRQHETNVLGVFLTTKAALSYFTGRRRHRHRHQLRSQHARASCGFDLRLDKGRRGHDHKALAKELDARQIRVNAINLCFVVTERAHSVPIVGSDFERGAIVTTPLGRAGRPEDTAPPVSFWASDDAGWITGETIFVSGGAGI